MLPPPTLSFTIPSYDDVVLDCRIYHPSCLAPKTIGDVAEWGKKAAIVAHPYATLGGSYDDPVVGIVASTILKQGFVVGTFNFRGAGKGRTSWTSQPEQNDYISFISFMIYYIHHLSPPPTPLDLPIRTKTEASTSDLKSIPSQIFVQHYTSAPSPKRGGIDASRPTLLLAGYSYGALITTLLPPILSSILTPFQTPVPGTPFASLRLRALSLATQSNIQILSLQSEILAKYSVRRGRSLDTIRSSKRYSTGSGVRTGGDEDLRRSSHDSYRSRSSFTIETQEKIKHSFSRVRSITSSNGRNPPKRQSTHRSFSSFRSSSSRSRKSGKSSAENLPLPSEVPKIEEPSNLEAIPGLMKDVQIAYLLISPLQGLVNSLATLWTAKPFNAKTHHRNSIPENERKLTIDPTLALWGTGDVFVSVKRLRSWAERLSDMDVAGKETFRCREVQGAGHFWNTREAIEVLKDEVGRFVESLGGM